MIYTLVTAVFAAYRHIYQIEQFSMYWEDFLNFYALISFIEPL